METFPELTSWKYFQQVHTNVRVLRIDARTIEIARQHQEGRASPDDAIASFKFTEGWFRNSGLYDLEAEWVAKGEDDPKHAQLRFMEWFCEEQNCDVLEDIITNCTGKGEVVLDPLTTGENMSLLDRETKVWDAKGEQPPNRRFVVTLRI